MLDRELNVALREVELLREPLLDRLRDLIHLAVDGFHDAAGSRRSGHDLAVADLVLEEGERLVLQIGGAALGRKINLEVATRP